MTENIYFNGELIPVEDWDYDTRRPKIKAAKQEVPEESIELIQD